MLIARPDADADALLAHRISLGGYWLPRGLAFKHRFVAVVDGDVIDVPDAWKANLSPAQGTLAGRLARPIQRGHVRAS